VYNSSDVVGVEIAGSLKNVLAIAAGMSDGLGFGDNSKGALLARGLKEMILLGRAMGARVETFLGIAGVGDLFATASSKLSRNYRVGRALGEGRSVSAALQEIGQVAEGLSTAESVMVLSRRYQVEIPVFGAVEAVVRGRMRPVDGVATLMDRSTKDEGLWL
jgi:glycerol-3-phosphate dehydrogenase (NAD(P)+)